MDAYDVQQSFLRSVQAVPISSVFGGSGTNNIFTPAAGKFWVVLNLSFYSNNAVSLKWSSGSSGDLTGTIPIAAGARIDWLPNLAPLFRAVKQNDILTLYSSAAATISGFATIVQATY